MRFLLLIGCTALAAGCASQPAPEPLPVVIAAPPATLIPDNEPIRVTVAGLGGDLGGAAYRVHGYRDVLRRDREGAFEAPMLDTSTMPYGAMSRQLETISLAQSDANNAVEPVNPAWQRYCDAGVGMTDADWKYVIAHGAPKGVPDRIAHECNYPK